MADRPSKPCPICGAPSVEKFRPFCSARCADVDLNRWLTGRHVIPADDTDPEADGSLDEIPTASDEDD